MTYLQRYSNIMMLIAVLAYVHSGQASGNCQNSFLKRPNAHQMLSLLQSGESVQNKKKALEFFKRHYVTDLKVHRALIHLFSDDVSTELMEAAIKTLTLSERKEILYEMLDYESSHVKKTFLKMMIRQIEKALYDVLKYDISTETLIFLIQNEDYEYNYKAQRHLIQLFIGPDQNKELKKTAENRLKVILNSYWEDITAFEQQDNVDSVFVESLFLLLEKEGVYDPLLYKYFSNVLKERRNVLSVRMNVLESLKDIYSIELSRLYLLDGIVKADFSYKQTRKLFKKVNRIKKRADRTIRSIQKVLMDMIKSEVEISHPLIIKSIELLGEIEIFNHEARVLLEDIYEDQSIFSKIREVAGEALTDMENARTFEYSDAE